MSKAPDIIQSLSILEPGKIPLDIFNAVARLIVTPVVEIVPIYKNNEGSIKVLLLKRAEDKSSWSGMYHVPGTIVLPTDTPGSLSDALQRITHNKLKSFTVTNPVYVDTQLCRVSRGMELAIIYFVILKSVPDESFLFDQNHLPSNLIEGHENFINIALRKSNYLSDFS